MLISFLVVIITFIIIILIGYIIFLKLYKKHTRERFAFVGLTAGLALISTFILQIYSSKGIITSIIDVKHFYLKAEHEGYDTDVKDHIIVFITITLLIYWIYKIHQNWNGPFSTIHNSKKRFREENNIYQESLIQIKDFFTSQKLIIPHSPSIDSNKYSVFSSTELDKTPWFEEVNDLFTFRSRQYQINIDTDYYSEENCYISQFGQNEGKIAILCNIYPPKDQELNKFLDFIFIQHLKYSKVIVAIKNSAQKRKTISIRGVDIDVRNKNELLTTLIDFKFYKEFIREQFETKEITEGSNIALKDFYVDLKGKTEKGDKIDSIEKYTLDWLNSTKDSNKHLGILGEYGCGKSVFSLRITHLLLSNRNLETRIPILIELRGKSPRNLSMLEILSTWATSFRIEPIALLKLHREGKLLIIFEGFDEMDMVGDKEIRFFHFQRLWEFAIPKSKIIITGRPNFFLDDKELKTNLGIDKPFETSHFCEAIYLDKLHKKQITDALRNIDIEIKSQVLNIIDENSQSSSNFYDLISRPAILYLVSVIWKERKLSKYKGMINSAIVIGEFIQFSYSRQSEKKIFFPLTQSEREFFMLGVAIGMHKVNSFSNQINKSDLENINLKLYRDFPIEVLSVKNATQERAINLKERLSDNVNAEEMVFTDVRSCGLLVKDISRNDYFKFAHKSFLEYLVSLYFVEAIIKDKGHYFVMVRSIAESLDITLNNFIHSNETIMFTSEILINKLDQASLGGSKKEIAAELFEILHPNKFLSRYPRIAIFINKIFSGLFLTYSLMLLMFSLLSLFRDFDEPNSLNATTTTLLMISMIAVAFLSLRTRTTTRNTKRRLVIWLQCCKQLEISDSSLRSIVSKNYTNYLNDDSSLDYLLWFLKKKINKPKKE